eukprot:SAG11_NODE_2734_length_3030_cov_1.940293_1_plen_150_part_00
MPTDQHKISGGFRVRWKQWRCAETQCAQLSIRCALPLSNSKIVIPFPGFADPTCVITIKNPRKRLAALADKINRFQTISHATDAQISVRWVRQVVSYLKVRITPSRARRRRRHQEPARSQCRIQRRPTIGAYPPLRRQQSSSLKLRAAR